MKKRSRSDINLLILFGPVPASVLNVLLCYTLSFRSQKKASIAGFPFGNEWEAWQSLSSAKDRFLFLIMRSVKTVSVNPNPKMI